MAEGINREFGDSFILCRRYAEDKHNIIIILPMFEPILPSYYISVVNPSFN